MEIVWLLSICPSLYTAINTDSGALFIVCHGHLQYRVQQKAYCNGNCKFQK